MTAVFEPAKQPASPLAYVRVDFKFKTEKGYGQEVGYSSHGTDKHIDVLMEAIYELTRVASVAGFGQAALDEARKAVCAVNGWNDV